MYSAATEQPKMVDIVNNSKMIEERIYKETLEPSRIIAETPVGPDVSANVRVISLIDKIILLNTALFKYDKEMGQYSSHRILPGLGDLSTTVERSSVTTLSITRRREIFHIINHLIDLIKEVPSYEKIIADNDIDLAKYESKIPILMRENDTLEATTEAYNLLRSLHALTTATTTLLNAIKSKPVLHEKDIKKLNFITTDLSIAINSFDVRKIDPHNQKTASLILENAKKALFRITNFNYHQTDKTVGAPSFLYLNKAADIHTDIVTHIPHQTMIGMAEYSAVQKLIEADKTKKEQSDAISLIDVTIVNIKRYNARISKLIRDTENGAISKKDEFWGQLYITLDKIDKSKKELQDLQERTSISLSVEQVETINGFDIRNKLIRDQLRTHMSEITIWLSKKKTHHDVRISAMVEDDQVIPRLKSESVDEYISRVVEHLSANIDDVTLDYININISNLEKLEPDENELGLMYNLVADKMFYLEHPGVSGGVSSNRTVFLDRAKKMSDDRISLNRTLHTFDVEQPAILSTTSASYPAKSTGVKKTKKENPFAEHRKQYSTSAPKLKHHRESLASSYLVSSRKATQGEFVKELQRVDPEHDNGAPYQHGEELGTIRLFELKKESSKIFMDVFRMFHPQAQNKPAPKAKELIDAITEEFRNAGIPASEKLTVVEVQSKATKGKPSASYYSIRQNNIEIFHLSLHLDHEDQDPGYKDVYRGMKIHYDKDSGKWVSSNIGSIHLTGYTHGHLGNPDHRDFSNTMLLTPFVWGKKVNAGSTGLDKKDWEFYVQVKENPHQPLRRPDPTVVQYTDPCLLLAANRNIYTIGKFVVQGLNTVLRRSLIQGEGKTTLSQNMIKNVKAENQKREDEKKLAEAAAGHSDVVEEEDDDEEEGDEEEGDEEEGDEEEGDEEDEEHQKEDKEHQQEDKEEHKGGSRKRHTRGYKRKTRKIRKTRKMRKQKTKRMMLRSKSKRRTKRRMKI
jgi:hypothetical protein